MAGRLLCISLASLQWRQSHHAEGFQVAPLRRPRAFDFVTTCRASEDDVVAGFRRAAGFEPSFDASDLSFDAPSVYDGDDGEEEEAIELFVRNIDYAAEEADLSDAFAKAGAAPIAVAVPRDRGTGRGRGFAFVTLGSRAEARLARQAMDGALFRGRRLSVHDRTPNPAGAAQRGARDVNERLAAAATARDVLSVLFDDGEQECTSVNLATALHRAARHGANSTDSDRLRQLFRLSTESIRLLPRSWEPRHLSNACWAAARLRSDVDSQPLLRAVAEAAPGRMAHFNAQGLSNVAWAYAKMIDEASEFDSEYAPETDVSRTRLFDALAVAARAKMKSFSPQGLAITAWAFSKTKTAAPALYAAIATEAQVQIGGFGGQECANIAWAFASAQHRASPLFGGRPRRMDAPLFEAVAGRATACQMGSFAPQALSNLAWAFATVGCAPDLDDKYKKLYDSMDVEAASKLALFKSQEISNVVWALSKVGRLAKQGSLCNAVRRRIVDSPASLETQHRSTVVWAFANADIDAPDFYNAIGDSIRAQDDFSAQVPRGPRRPSRSPGPEDTQALSNLAWALSKKGALSEHAARSIARAALMKRRLLAASNAQGLANLAWAYANAGVFDDVLFEALADVCSKRIGEFSAQALANVGWAYATASGAKGADFPSLFDAIAGEAPRKISTFNAQELANTAWAFSTAGVAAPALFQAIAAEVPKKIETFKPQALANTVWAYSTAGFAAPLLFDAVAAEALRQISTFKSQELATTLWAYSTAGVEAPVLFDAAANEASKKIKTFNPQDLANIVWAYSTAGVEAPALFEAIALEIGAKIDDFSLEELSQMHQVSMHLRLGAPRHALVALLKGHEAQLRAAHLRREPSPSRSQRDVSAALLRIGWGHDFEHVTAEGISLDMAQPQFRLAIEFDGPKHYLIGRADGEVTRALDGRSKAKERVLGHLGWRLLRVPYFEWGVLRTPQQQEAYLRSGIADAFG
ncbi:hypothetical protein M885DRAFT_511337 [Pelagophyceae sp. CCMP2097]|nr:hypothetical protein M885DRAFT_511337 [Pelagophyceae sp. CCMP2097]